MIAAGIAAALRAIAPPGVVTGCRAIDASDEALLHDDERAAINTAVAKRRREFATGRALLHEITGDPTSVGVDPGRRPMLPAGVVGSLAHDDTYAVAAITRDAAITALGVDIEPSTPLSAELAAVILRPDEGTIDAHLAFTLKEAVYKAWSALGGGMLDHHQVLLVLEGDRFRAQVLDDAGHFAGRFTTVGDRILALVVVVAGQPG